MVCARRIRRSIALGSSVDRCRRLVRPRGRIRSGIAIAVAAVAAVAIAVAVAAAAALDRTGIQFIVIDKMAH